MGAAAVVGIGEPGRKMIIRKSMRADHPRLVGIWLDASRVGHPFLGEDVLQDQLPKVRDVYLPAADNWVAEDGGILGFIGLLDNHVGALFVSPEEQRRGVGRLLIDHAATLHEKLTVDVYEANGRAISFYESCGFRSFGRKELDDEGRPFPLICMQRLHSSAPHSPTPGAIGGRAGPR